jgi:hypothetical protein
MGRSLKGKLFLYDCTLCTIDLYLFTCFCLTGMETHLSERFFYGEVSIQDPDTEQNIVYVVEQINILTKLMRYNEKILRNILYVMENGVTPAAKYNAVVTKGASLMNFMVTINPTERKLGSFLVFSTNHNSYITAGEPQMDVDETGKISFSTYNHR